MSIQGSTASLGQDLQSHQPQFNNLIPSERTSPIGSQLNLNADQFLRRTSVQTSPVHLAQNLHDLSLSTSGLKSTDAHNSTIQSPSNEGLHQQLYIIKIRNLPNDITLREAHCIFTFAKDFAGFELLPDSNNLPTIYAKFKSLSAASTCSQVLESSQVFGPSYPYYLKTEIVDSSFTSQPSIGSSAKRPSIGTQRSRFLFSDPFSNEPIAEEQNGVGKSLLMMESQQDAREYDQLVRDPWQTPAGSNGSIAPTSTQGVPPSQQQQQQVSSQPNTGNASFSNSNPQTPGVEWDRRRQGSVFFNNQSPLLSGQLSSSQISTSLSLNQPPQSAQQAQSSSGVSLAPLSAPASQQLLSNSNSQPQSAVPSSGGAKLPGAPSNIQSTLSNNNNNNSGSQQSSQVDLSLLARVPPPANPADQNPPCNTLYVGNLPPDATEAELRQLFSPQRGFRRLSFKTKTQSSNGGTSMQSGHIHGPMCFVEFEDVAYATRALAELYGRTLPRPGGLPGKGGIRLSFSKNPLGVRGPGQRRTSGFSNFNQPNFKN